MEKNRGRRRQHTLTESPADHVLPSRLLGNRLECTHNWLRKLEMGGLLMMLHTLDMRPLISRSYMIRRGYGRLLPKQARNQIRSAKCRDVFGDPREG